MILEELVVALGWKLEGQQNLRAFEAGLGRLRTGLDRFKSLATIGGAAIAGVGVAAVAAGAAMAASFGPRLAKDALQAGMQFEGLRTTLEVLEGSSEKAKASLDWVADFAEKTPLGLQEVSEAFIRMRAYGLDPTNGSLKALGDAASGLNKPIMAAVEAMADAITGENERLKEFGITASKTGDRITYTWNKNGQKLTRTVKKDAREIQRALTDIMDQQFGGMMDRRAETMEGRLGRLRDKWGGFLRDIAGEGQKGSFFSFIEDELAGLDRVLEHPSVKGKIQQFARDIGTGFRFALTKVGEGAVWVANKFRENQPAIERWGAALREAASVSWETTLRELSGIDKFLSQPKFDWSSNTAREIENVQTAVTGLEKWFADLKLGEAMTRSLEQMRTDIEGFDLSAAGSAIGGRLLAALEGFDLSAAGSAIGTKLRAALEGVDLSAAGSAMMATLASGITSAGQAAVDAAKAVGERIRQSLENISPSFRINAPSMGVPSGSPASGPGAATGRSIGESLGRQTAPPASRPSVPSNLSNPEAPAVKKGASLLPRSVEPNRLLALGDTARRGLAPVRNTQTASIANTVTVNIAGNAKEADVRRGVAQGLRDAGRNPTRNLFFNVDSPVTA